jgi:predicted alpha/beta-fold hydrolase
MPVIESSFRPPLFLCNGHVQTILPAVLPRKFRHSFRRERVDVPDGDFLETGWLETGAQRLAILSHGLEGCFDNDYILGMATALSGAGWDVLAWNLRGCGTEPNRNLRFYHSGETEDLRFLVNRAAERYPRIALVGFSLGGNITLKYAGEAPAPPAVRCAVGISVPVDLAASARALDERWGNRVYLQRFLATLIRKIEVKARHFPDELSTVGLRRIRSFQEFDDRYTAPLHGFRDAMDYWTQSSARQFLPRITVPTLLLNAKNDPFLTAESFPFPEAEANPRLFFEAPESGGHCGFLDLKNGLERWSERRVAAFLREMASPHT